MTTKATNRTMWVNANQRAIIRSMSEEYKGCAVHISPIVKIGNNGLPEITGYAVSDWMDGNVLATYVNGRLVP